MIKNNPYKQHLIGNLWSVFCVIHQDCICWTENLYDNTQDYPWTILDC